MLKDFLNKGISTPIAIIIILILVILVGGVIYWQYSPKKPLTTPSTLTECSEDSDCICCDAVLKKETDISLGEKVCINKNYEADCLIEEHPDAFCALHSCKCQEGKCTTVPECETCIGNLQSWCKKCQSRNWPIGGENSPILHTNIVKCYADCFDKNLPKTNYCSETKNLCEELGFEVKDETADWKIYKNEDYRYEIGYLSGYEIDQSISPSRKNEIFRVYNKDSLEEIRFGYLVNAYSVPSSNACCGGCKFEEREVVVENIRIQPIIYSDVSSRSSYYYEPRAEKLEECEMLPLIEHTIFGEFCVDEDFNYQSSRCKEGDENFFHQILLSCKGKNFEGIKGKDKCSQLFYKILSTLKFVKEEEKTHKDKEYGYKIKYPSDWKMSKNVLGAFDIYKDFDKHRCSVEIYANVNKYLYPIEGSEEYFQGFSESKISIEQKKVSIGDVSAIKISSPELQGREIYSFKKKIGEKIYFGEKIEGRDYYFNIFLEATDLASGRNVIVGDHGCGETFNQILSTFKFDEDAYIKELTDESVCEYRKGEYETRVYDSQGRVTGVVSGKIKEEIPGSHYEKIGDHHHVYFDEGRPYLSWEIFCIEKGNYKMTQQGFVKGHGEWVSFEVINIPITSGVTHHYQFDWESLKEGKEGAVLFVDIDNDGVFDKTITSDKELTCEEFIIQLKKR